MNDTSTAMEKAENNTEIKQWVEGDAFKNAIKSSLPQHLTPERFIRIALTAIMKTPKLAFCSKESLFKCLLDLSSMGLEPDGRLAHLIPFDVKDKVTQKVIRTDATLIIDYKGLIELSKRSGEIKSWRAETVCEKDYFAWDNGKVDHKIDWLKPRGKTLAVYSHVLNKNNEDDFEVMTLEQIEGIRSRSRASKSGPWVTDFNEMAKKTVIRRHSKRLSLSPEFTDSLQKDGDLIEDFAADYTIEDLTPQRLSDKPKENLIEMPLAKDLDAKISNKNLTLIMEKIKLSQGAVSSPSLLYYLKNNYSIERLTDIKEVDVDSICAWISSQKREPGCEPEEAQAPPVEQKKQPAKTTDRPAWMNEPISEAQSKRFYAISKNSGYTDEQIKAYLLDEYGIESSRDIPKGDYETICEFFKS